MIVAHLPTRELHGAVGEVDGVTLVIDDDRADEVSFAVAPYATGPDAVRDLNRFPSLQVVQLQSAGYDGMPELLPDGVRLCNATGVHDDATSELALGLIIASLRRIPEAVRAHGHWGDPPGRRSLADSRVLIVGFGSIGHALAQRLSACKAEVVGVASRARNDDLLGRVHGIESLPDLLPTADVVVLLVPHTPSTDRLVDDAFLARMRDDTLLVNVARGAVADTDAIVAHAGRLRFALDVTDPEPLPEDHPLWQAPEVLITPHIAGGTDAMLPRVAALVRDQLERFVAGGDLANLVHQG